VRVHAEDFRRLVSSSLEPAFADAVLVCPYDAELFGHWWHEGVPWLDAVLEVLRQDPGVELTTLSRHLENRPPREVVPLPEGSWGRGGQHEVWRNPGVEWSWRLIYPLESEVWDLHAEANRSGHADAQRAVRCGLKQLLLLQASDWQFLITTQTATDYATERIRRHAEDLAALNQIARALLEGAELSDADRASIEELERRDELFPDLPETIEDAVRGAEAAQATRPA
jgi:1,4-alpha-glucan branching enzyme